MAQYYDSIQRQNLFAPPAAADDGAEAAAENMLTMVTNSPAPSEQLDAPDVAPVVSIGVCRNRAAGQVCICDTCEATRTRLLHRSNKSDGTTITTSVTAANHNKKRVRNVDEEEEEEDSTKEVVSKAKVPADNVVVDERLATMSAACKTILECIGEDPTREGLLKTPERWAKSLLFMCHGYHLTPADVTNGAVFAENHNEMVVVRNIDIHSLCEHHMVPFTGRVHIGYIPNGKILGLSKLARIAELYARRLQVQERLTRQIADAVLAAVAPLGVAVVVECTHYCMVMRGVQKTGTVTTTSSVRGCFETNSKTRAEFFSILHGGMKSC
jgi:GTP cyclohydrolase I